MVSDITVDIVGKKLYEKCRVTIGLAAKDDGTKSL